MTVPISKKSLYEFCRTFVGDRKLRIENNIRDVRESLNSETKSSAGDKHETGRAMLQLEREKLGQQLAEAEKMEQVLSKVRWEKISPTAILGSWVRTSKADYFLAISAGRFRQGENEVFCISMATPIGQLLLGKAAGDSMVFNGTEIEILSLE